MELVTDAPGMSGDIEHGLEVIKQVVSSLAEFFETVGLWLEPALCEVGR